MRLAHAHRAAIDPDEGVAAADLARQVREQADEAGRAGLDLDQLAEGGISEGPPPAAPYDLADLRAILGRPELLPEGWSTQPAGERDRLLRAPGADRPVRVTADPDYFDLHAPSVEFFAPGSPLFPSLPPAVDPPDRSTFARLVHGEG